MPPESPDPAAGVFETVRVRDGNVHALAAHLDRLARSMLELYGAPLGDEPRRLLTGSAAVLAGEHRLRLDAIPGPARPRFETTVSALAPTASRPVALRAVTVPGGLGAHKWRDRRLLDELGDAPVPLLVEPDGTVLEAAFANVWLLRGERLVTPPADGRILPGVTRALLLARAGGLGLSAVEGHVSVEDLRGADAIILTSAARLAVAAALDAAPAEPPALARIRAALGAS